MIYNNDNSTTTTNNNIITTIIILILFIMINIIFRLIIIIVIINREGAARANSIFNSLTHVLNSLISLMCGCLFVGPVHLCVLKSFPV